MRAISRIGLIVGLSLLGACGADNQTSTTASATPAAKARPNVLFIMIDTVRADHCSVYGYDLETTPNLKRLAAQGVRFDRAYSPIATTAPSTLSVFTSLYPITHRYLKNGLTLDNQLTLASEQFHAAGYRTAGFISAVPLKGSWGFNRGFDRYVDSWELTEEFKVTRNKAGEEVRNVHARRGAYTTDSALDWYRSTGKEPGESFVFVHYFDAHEPYAPPPEVAERFLRNPATATHVERDIAEYDAELSYVDAEVGRLLDTLEAEGLLENTLVVLWADHGQGLWTHGWLGHGAQLYEEAVHVPLLMMWDGTIPGGSVYEQPVELIDILPTVLEYTGIGSKKLPMHGRSLVAYMEGSPQSAEDHAIFFQRREYAERTELFGGIVIDGPMFGVRRFPWKYIEAPNENRFELYNLVSDPGERTNVFAESPEQAKELHTLLSAWREKYGRDGGLDSSLSPEEKSALEALGYTQ